MKHDGLQGLIGDGRDFNLMVVIRCMAQGREKLIGEFLPEEQRGVGLYVQLLGTERKKAKSPIFGEALLYGCEVFCIVEQ